MHGSKINKSTTTRFSHRHIMGRGCSSSSFAFGFWLMFRGSCISSQDRQGHWEKLQCSVRPVVHLLPCRHNSPPSMAQAAEPQPASARNQHGPTQLYQKHPCLQHTSAQIGRSYSCPNCRPQIALPCPNHLTLSQICVVLNSSPSKLNS